jgi:hypothetical protein
MYVTIQVMCVVLANILVPRNKYKKMVIIL